MHVLTTTPSSTMDDLTIMSQSSSPPSYMRNGMQVPCIVRFIFQATPPSWVLHKNVKYSNMTRAKASREKDEWKEPSKVAWSAYNIATCCFPIMGLTPQNMGFPSRTSPRVAFVEWPHHSIGTSYKVSFEPPPPITRCASFSSDGFFGSSCGLIC